jgi:hypothetical protein
MIKELWEIGGERERRRKKFMNNSIGEEKALKKTSFVSLLKLLRHSSDEWTIFGWFEMVLVVQKSGRFWSIREVFWIVSFSSVNKPNA